MAGSGAQLGYARAVVGYMYPFDDAYVVTRESEILLPTTLGQAIAVQ